MEFSEGGSIGVVRLGASQHLLCHLALKVTEMKFRLNYDLLKSYISLVITPDRLPGLSDHKEPCKHLTVLQFVLCYMLWPIRVALL